MPLAWQPRGETGSLDLLLGETFRPLLWLLMLPALGPRQPAAVALLRAAAVRLVLQMHRLPSVLPVPLERLCTAPCVLSALSAVSFP